MKIAVTGSHGLIGEALCKHLSGQGHIVARIIRASNSASGDIHWNPANGSIESDKLNGVDAVIHLAGENIASHRWTAEQKQKIKESRIRGTKLLADTICGLEKKPEVVVSGSAIGFYGDRGSETLTESSNVGSGFLADVCREWEEAIAPVAAAGVRVVNARTGVVLSTKAGALNKMLPIFQLGGGGNIGDGRQYMSWISLDDEIKALEFALTHSSVSGPVNLVAPNPVTNAEFTAVLGSVLHRPAFVPLPAFAAKIILGEMADELLLSSQKCQPTKLQSAGYQFEYPDLKEALSTTLQEKK
ncbi:MAG TPA: TIGR01777 family oxidoreductase [Oculatellaceae cyanobacterium]